MRAGLLSQFALTTHWLALAAHGFVANDALLRRAATRLAASDDVSASRRELASDNVSASRRELEARFGTGKPADPSKTMAFLKSKGLVGSDRGPAVASVVDEAGAVAELVEQDALKSFASSLEARVADGDVVVDDMSAAYPLASNGNSWRPGCDQVMGGLSVVTAHGRETVGGRAALVLRGRVTTANNGGFVSLGLDVDVDASAYSGVRLTVRAGADDETYGLHLRTPDCARVFSSYRSRFAASTGWSTVDLPWEAFAGNGPGAAETPLDPARLRRLSLLGIGRDFDADLAVADIRFYR